MSPDPGFRYAATVIGWMRGKDGMEKRKREEGWLDILDSMSRQYSMRKMCTMHNPRVNAFPI